MQAIIRTIQNAFLNELKTDKNFSEKGISDSFWDELTNDLIGFQENVKPIYAKIYSLNLENPEAIISKVPDFYALLIDEVAEKYVLDTHFHGAIYFKETKNQAFLKQVAYLKTLQNVITKVERKNLKLDLDKGTEHLNYSVSDEEVEQVIKAQERQALKKKFAQWDKELEPTTPESEPKKQTKVISLSWVKYAVAACLVLGFIIWQPYKLSNDEIFTTYTSDEIIVASIENPMKVVDYNRDIRGDDFLFENLTSLETEQAVIAISNFKESNFEMAKKYLYDIKSIKKNNQLLLFLAISQLKTNELISATSNLKLLEKIENDKNEADIKFYLALSYLKQNKKKKAKILFKELAIKNNKHSKDAESILKEMRWY